MSCSEAEYLAPVVPLLSQPVDQRALPEAAAVVWEAASTVPDPSVTGGRHLDDIKEYATFPLTCVKNKVVDYIFFCTHMFLLCILWHDIKYMINGCIQWALFEATFDHLLYEQGSYFLDQTWLLKNRDYKGLRLKQSNEPLCPVSCIKKPTQPPESDSTLTASE